MGGGSNSSPPVDTAPGGGTYPTDAFGTAYNPSWQNQGFNWGTFGHGLQQTGSAYGQSQSGGGMGGVQSPVSQNNPGAFPASLIPDARKSKEDAKALEDALRRIMAVSQASKKNVIVPDTGAAKYMYVDPRARAYDPMAAYNDEQGHDNLGLLPQGAQPSF